MIISYEHIDISLNHIVQRIESLISEVFELCHDPQTAGGSCRVQMGLGEHGESLSFFEVFSLFTFWFSSFGSSSCFRLFRWIWKIGLQRLDSWEAPPQERTDLFRKKMEALERFGKDRTS